jgi:hypothetical protein
VATVAIAVAVVLGVSGRGPGEARESGSTRPETESPVTPSAEASAGDDAGVSGTNTDTAGAGLSDEEAAALEEQLKAIEEELDAIDLPSDADFEGIEDELR